MLARFYGVHKKFQAGQGARLNLVTNWQWHRDNDIAKCWRREDGESGLTAALSLPTDLIVTDVEMPLLLGLDLLKAILAAKPHCPVVVMTANAERCEVEAGRRGAFTVLSKPFHLKVFFEIFSHAFANLATRRRPRTSRAQS